MTIILSFSLKIDCYVINFLEIIDILDGQTFETWNSPDHTFKDYYIHLGEGNPA